MSQTELCDLGYERVKAFCEVNEMPVPSLHVVPRADWFVSACAYWRPDTAANRKYTSPGINICLEECQRPAKAEQFRNWSWPSCSIDRTPYGVLAHELGHAADWWKSPPEGRGSYGGTYSEEIMKASGEPPLTGYAPNPWEWFAEHFRLFVTNTALLLKIRPKTCSLLLLDWAYVSGEDWEEEIGPFCPNRVKKSQLRKAVKV